MFDGPEPIYLQISTYLREQITNGSLTAGEQVMSTTQFAKTYRINPATAGKALNMLVAEGLLVKRRGLGMFVTDDAQAKLLSTKRDQFVTDVLEPFLKEAALAGYSPAEITDLVATTATKTTAENDSAGPGND